MIFGRFWRDRQPVEKNRRRARAERAQRRAQRYQLDAAVGLTPAERAARGKAARAAVPRGCHAGFDPPPDRPGPVGLLEQQATSQVPELVPVR